MTTWRRLPAHRRQLGFDALSLAGQAVTLVAVLCGCGTGVPADPDEALSGGQLTVFDTTRDAFGRPAPTLSTDRVSRFFVGNSFFTNHWVIAPASTQTRDGLGPTFNARACASCHFKDGRGRPPADASELMSQMLVRLSVPGTDAHGGPVAEPSYGGQFNPLGVPGVPGEGFASVRWIESSGRYADGESYTLRRPELVFNDLAFGPFSDSTLFSARVPPAVYGLGLLGAVPEEQIVSFADPDDKDGDGISGRTNRVWDEASQKTVLGRFGWKANQPNLRQQTAGAFLGDIGITSSLFPRENCTSVQSDCLTATNGGMPEVADQILDDVVFYGKTLAVPARRDIHQPEVSRGKNVFNDLGCAACHRPRLQTTEAPGFPELAYQTIRPYTDLLLHDMGPELADNRPDFLASGREWRTPPLWGIGLVETVNAHHTLLHDGRARGFAEAILWHGGEAEKAREAFKALSKADRDALSTFLKSL